MTVNEMDVNTKELSFADIMTILAEHPTPQESRTDEFYAVAQLLEFGELTADEQKQLGAKCVEIIERDHWWRSNGAFNDE